MMTTGIFLRFSIFTLLIVVTHTYPQKGTQSTGQFSSGGNVGANYASYHSGGPSLASAPYSAVGDAYGATYGLGPSVYQPVVMPNYPGLSMSGPTVSVGGPGAALGATMGGPSSAVGATMGGPSTAVGATMGGPSTAVGATMGGPSTAMGAAVSPMGGPGDSMGGYMGGPGTVMTSVLPGAAFVASPQVYEPVGEYSESPDEQPATQWTVPTTVFEAGSSDSQYLSEILPPAPSPPQGPTLRSGETSNVVKEAELGNYQQQTEEFGYPADLSRSDQVVGQSLGTVLVPSVQLGGLRPAPSMKFDRMLLYGLYPPGSYSTFSQNHEAGKDYSQDIHYLKEHITESHGSGQQKKFFPGGL